jgi:plastocyanin
MRRVLTALLAAAGLALAPAAAAAKGPAELPSVDYPGIQHLHYEYGPIAIAPGQNTIELEPNKLKPQVPGYITRFKPNLVYARDHTVPRVDVLHLHHGVWLIRGYPTFAAGEEKTIFQAPEGYGFHHDPGDRWDMNYMIHNLTPNPESVYLTYDLDFLPDAEPAAASMRGIEPLWMDVAGISAYPVFDVKRGWGTRGKYTFPKQARGAQRANIGAAHRFTAPRDMTLVGTGGHLHPGGLHTDLTALRGGQARNVFRSEAEYFEPAGAVSWDVAMTVTEPDWKVAVKAGDGLEVSATYDTRRGSWYESMGIMVVWFTPGIVPGAKDPFTEAVDNRGIPSHGHLPENDNHGGAAVGLPDARTLLSGATASTVLIKDFLYGRGDLNNALGRVPTVRQGRALTFANRDDSRTIWHTVTGCRAPCNRATGIAYPLADGASFDSGEIGTDPTRPYFTASSGRRTWKTPTTLKPGTYNYFCRIHPFMRGAFRVVAR